MKPQYPEWVYPIIGIGTAALVLTFVTALVVDGRDKPARPLDRIAPNRL